MIKSLLRKTEPVTECLYNSQTGAVVLLCTFIYKVSTLVGIIAMNMRSSTLWTYLALTVVDLICLALIYPFFRDGTDDNPIVRKSLSYKIGLTVALALLFLKAVVYFSFCVTFLTAELFREIPYVLLLLILILSSMYLAAKGIRGIARISELTFLPVLFIFIMNIAFLSSEMDFGRNLPVFSMPPAEFFSETGAYGLWLGDFLPLIFIRQRNKRLPYFGIGVAVCWGLVLVVVALGSAIYGNALKFISGILLKLATFNQLSAEIGRMEWTTLFVTVIMGVIQLAFILWGMEECSHRLFGSKIFIRVAYFVVIVATIAFAPSIQTIIDFSVINAVGYCCGALIVLLSFYLFNVKCRSDKKLLESSGILLRITKAELKENTK